MTEQERNAVNTLVNQYVTCLCLRERITQNILLEEEHFPKMLYEVEVEIDEIRLILNTFLLDDYRD